MQRLMGLPGGILLALLVFGGLHIVGIFISQTAEPPTSAQNGGTTTVIGTPAAPIQDVRDEALVGLGRPRDSLQSVFEKPEVGFAFEPAADVGGQPQVAGYSSDGRAVLQLIGPPENLVGASITVNLVDDTSTGLSDNLPYLLGLVKLGVPGWEEGTAWVHNNIDTVMQTGVVEATYAHLQIRMELLRDDNALALSVVDQDWGVPALASAPTSEPTREPAPDSRPQPAETADLPNQPQEEPAASMSESDGGESTAVINNIVREADISEVTNLVLQALADHHGLSRDDHTVVYRALGRTKRAIDLLYGTGATGDVFRAAEDLLVTQLAVLDEVETATLSQDLADLRTAAPMLVDLGERRLVFNRQVGNEVYVPSYSQEELDVVTIVRDDAALQSAITEVMAALAEGRPLDLGSSETVYQALGEASRGLDLIDEIGETGDVFEAAVSVLEHRRTLLTDLESAVISGNIGDLRAVAEDWVRLSQEQLRFERQLAAEAGHAVNTNPATEILSLELYVEQAAAAPEVYEVRAGETLSGVADHFDTTVEELARLNNITDPRSVRPGTTLVVGAPSLPSTATTMPFVYEVQEGDNLSWIAQRHGLAVETLIQVNDLDTPDILLPGQHLLIADRPLAGP